MKVGDLMNINDYLYEVYDATQKEILINKIQYWYVDVKYNYKENQFIRCFVFDFTNDMYEKIFQEWKDFNRFLEFQREVLEDEFFNSDGDERYNLYLIFIVKKDSSIYKISDITKDFRYARKFVFTENEAIEYFENLISLKREGCNFYMSDVANREQILKRLIESSKYGLNFFKPEIMTYLHLAKNKRQNRNLERVFPILEYGREIEKIFSEYSGEKQIKRNKIEDIECYQIKKINRLKIKDYRCFNLRKEIDFGKVNLIYGENGVGKTTLLEAIELGITGVNRKEPNLSNQTEIQVVCCNKKKTEVTLASNQDNSRLSKSWYGIQADSKNEFNEYFRRWNYFDSSWASTFAIDGQNQVELLQKFLDISNIEKGEILLKNFYQELYKLSKENLKSIDKISPLNTIFWKFSKHIQYKELSKMREEIKCRIQNYEVELNSLNNQINGIYLDEILNLHIKKIEKIFKILIASNDYKNLKVKKNGEIVAISNILNESISMSKMSTGQKVCLALAFMFSLFLSCDTSPNIIMLDEPVANLDDFHMLNLLDLLKRLAISDTQIFFTTANPDVAKLFRRKFSFLDEDFKYFTVKELQDAKIECETFSPKKEESIKRIII